MHLTVIRTRVRTWYTSMYHSREYCTTIAHPSYSRVCASQAQHHDLETMNAAVHMLRVQASAPKAYLYGIDRLAQVTEWYRQGATRAGGPATPAPVLDVDFTFSSCGALTAPFYAALSRAACGSSEAASAESGGEQRLCIVYPSDRQVLVRACVCACTREGACTFPCVHVSIGYFSSIIATCPSMCTSSTHVRACVRMYTCPTMLKATTF